MAGCSEWEFSVDFNNWGHITGTHWTLTDNFDSSIPQHYGDLVAAEIHSILDNNSIELKDLSDEVDKNTYLDRDTWEQYIFYLKKMKLL